MTDPEALHLCGEAPHYIAREVPQSVTELTKYTLCFAEFLAFFFSIALFESPFYRAYKEFKRSARFGPISLQKPNGA